MRVGLYSVVGPLLCIFFFFNRPPTTEIYTLSLHDALPIYEARRLVVGNAELPADAAVRAVVLDGRTVGWIASAPRSEEHTSELQSRFDLVCRLLLEKKKNKKLDRSRYKSTAT